jgi:glycosyltransferase involved in cell wall biosynthesis
MVPVYINVDAPKAHRLNRVHQLVECLSSVLISIDQANEPVTLVLVDDKSEINVADLLPSSLLQRVRLLRNTGTKGQAGALNFCLEHTTTPYIAMTDSDCIVGKDWIPTILANLPTQGELGLCGPNWRHQSTPGFWKKALTSCESSLMRHHFLERVDRSGQFTDRFDCRNFVLNVKRFEELSCSRKFFVESRGTSVSGITTHYIRDNYLTKYRVSYRYLEALHTYHEPIVSLRTQLVTYYIRGRRGSFRLIYQRTSASLLLSFFQTHLARHFVRPCIRNPLTTWYVICVHAAYWYGIVTSRVTNE